MISVPGPITIRGSMPPWVSGLPDLPTAMKKVYLAANPTGQVALGWMTSDPFAQPLTSILVQLYGAGGSAVAPPVSVATSDYPSTFVRYPLLGGLAVNLAGQALVAWDETSTPGVFSNASAFVQLVDTTGTLSGTPVQIGAPAAAPRTPHPLRRPQCIGASAEILFFRFSWSQKRNLRKTRTRQHLPQTLRLEIRTPRLAHFVHGRIDLDPPFQFPRRDPVRNRLGLLDHFRRKLVRQVVFADDDFRVHTQIAGTSENFDDAAHGCRAFAAVAKQFGVNNRAVQPGNVRKARAFAGTLFFVGQKLLTQSGRKFLAGGKLNAVLDARIVGDNHAAARGIAEKSDDGGVCAGDDAQGLAGGVAGDTAAQARAVGPGCEGRQAQSELGRPCSGGRRRVNEARTH